MSDNNDFKKFKPKKPKLAVPKEFLENANSYDDKLAMIKILSDREKNRVLLIIKSMLKDSVRERGRK
jgi:hypothetical protein